jgi:ABC-type nitrate/sulfonate/bicarbonate transport system permease component
MTYQIEKSKISGFVLVALLLLCWEIGCRTSWIDSNFLPPVSLIGLAIIQLVASMEIVEQVLITLRRVLVGYALGATVGYVLGFVCGYLPRVYHLLEVTIEWLRPMPSVALIPIGILFLGLGDSLNIFVIAWACSWPVFVNTMDGVRCTDQVLLNTGRTFGFDAWAVVRKIIVPSSLPYVFSGLRISLGIAIAVGVITEMVASGAGLGAFILNTSLSFRVPEMYAGIFTVGLFGYALNKIFLFVEGKTLRWQKGFLAQAK